MIRTASGNRTPCNCITRAGASPPRSQGQHFQRPFSGSTWKLGSRSSWNGQCHNSRRPDRFAAGPSRFVAIAAMSIRSLIASQSRRSLLDGEVGFMVVSP
jgi:hypothetical protein